MHQQKQWLVPIVDEFRRLAFSKGKYSSPKLFVAFKYFETFLPMLHDATNIALPPMKQSTHQAYSIWDIGSGTTTQPHEFLRECLNFMEYASIVIVFILLLVHFREWTVLSSLDMSPSQQVLSATRLGYHHSMFCLLNFISTEPHPCIFRESLPLRTLPRLFYSRKKTFSTIKILFEKTLSSQI